MIHIPNNLEQFEKTFGLLQTVKVGTIRSRGLSQAKQYKSWDRRKSSNKIATNLRQKLRDLIFIHPKSYMLHVQTAKNDGDIKEQSQYNESIDGKHKTNTNTNILTHTHLNTHDNDIDNEYYEEQDDDLPNTSAKKHNSIQLGVFGKFAKSKVNLHPIVECEGCGQTMDMNDKNLQETVITYDVLCINTTFFFHDELCVNFRKYKEIIRKYVSESELLHDKRSKNVPQYIRNLLSNFNNLIGVNSSNQQRPHKDNNNNNKDKSFTKVASVHIERGLSKLQELMTDFTDEKKDDIDDIFIPESISKERFLACVILSRELNDSDNSNSDNIVTKFADIPLEIKYCNTSIYGTILWEFIMEQLLTKQMESLWLLLAYFSSLIPTMSCIDLLETHIGDIAKVKNMHNLELVCESIIENSLYPIGTSLHLTNFILEIANHDLSRKNEFTDVADRYTIVAEKLVESVESDHLLSLYLEVPTNLNMMSVFEIAINFQMEDFFDNNRVDGIISHMWSQFDFLNPLISTFRVSDVDLYEMLTILFYHPAKFYYTPIGRYWISSSMYIAYVILITTVSEQQSYLYREPSFLEMFMWVCNGGYALYEIMEMTFRGVEYFGDSTNYFDMGIMTGWAVLAIMRFGYTFNNNNDLTEQQARNSRPTLLYMIIFGIQICILYCRIATIFVRSKTLGPFIRMIGGMVDDILNFTFVSLIFFLGFTFALRYILAEDITTECGSDEDISSKYLVSLFVFIILMGQQEWGTVTSNAEDGQDDPCFGEERAIVAQGFIIVFTVLGTVLLLNLLIAMMATTYEEKLETKSKEVQFSRTEEIYGLAHRPAIMSPPLNILVFGLAIIWFIIEGVIFFLTFTQYLLNIHKIVPISINYKYEIIKKEREKQRQKVKDTDDTDNNDDTDDYNLENDDYNNTCCCGLLSATSETSFSNLVKNNNKYCKFCRHYMNKNGNINEYLSLFRGYRLDEDDVKIIKNIFVSGSLCPQCYRPFKLYSDGSSNRLYRWQVVIEIISFYVFLIFLYLPLLIILCLPALFVGLWSFIQNLANSKSNKNNQNNLNNNSKKNNLIAVNIQNNYKNLIKEIVEQETTTEIQVINKKIDIIMDEISSSSSEKKDNNNGIGQVQFVQLLNKINDLNNQIKSLKNSIDLDKNKQSNNKVIQLSPRQKQKRFKKTKSKFRHQTGTGYQPSASASSSSTSSMIPSPNTNNHKMKFNLLSSDDDDGNDDNNDNDASATDDDNAKQHKSKSHKLKSKQQTVRRRKYSSTSSASESSEPESSSSESTPINQIIKKNIDKNNNNNNNDLKVDPVNPFALVSATPLSLNISTKPKTKKGKNYKKRKRKNNHQKRNSKHKISAMAKSPSHSTQL